MSHAFLTFELESGEFLSISVAFRRQVGDEVSLKSTLPYQHEIIYMPIIESDTLYDRVRSGDTIKIYKLNTSAYTTKKVFLGMIDEINKLKQKPRFFDTFTNNCTTNMMRHLRKSGLKVPRWHKTYILTNNLDNLLFKLNLIDTKCKTLEELNQKHDVTDLILKLKNSPTTSVVIRKHVSN